MYIYVYIHVYVYIYIYVPKDLKLQPISVMDNRPAPAAATGAAMAELGSFTSQGVRITISRSSRRGVL